MLDLTQFEGHTPGPWEPKRSEYFGTCVIQQGGLIVANLPNTKAEHIGFHVTCNGRGNDARLIAAAPDLLAEVKALRARVAELEGQSAVIGLDPAAVKRAIEVEPEFPGEMPDDLWMKIYDKDTLSTALRAAVQLTKRFILERVQDLPGYHESKRAEALDSIASAACVSRGRSRLRCFHPHALRRRAGDRTENSPVQR